MRRGLCLAKHQTRYDRPAVDPAYPDAQASLEGQIADLADAIAYNSHDLDDALGCGLINESDLEQISLYQGVKGQIEKQFPQAHRFCSSTAMR